MIGPGWLPVPRARARRLYPLAYARARPARPTTSKTGSAAAPRAASVDTIGLRFDARAGLPVATLQAPHARRLARLAHDLRGWLALRYAWLRPRQVPMLVAFLGMLATVQAVDYLAHPPTATVAGAAPTDGGRVMFKGGRPFRDGKPLDALPTSTYRVRLVVGP